MEIEYRKIEATDLEIFVQMRIHQLKEEGAISEIDLTPQLQAYYLKHLHDHTFVSWLATDGGEIIGTCGISFVEKPPYYGCPSGKIGLLSSMFVRKEYRRQGIGKILLDKIVAEAKDFGCSVIQITASEQGVPLYLNYGFEKNSNFMFLEI